jgi:dipeptidyl aminopeptidase/acylaminoacyl peptidase
VADVRDNGPTIYYRYDRQAKQAQKLFVSLAALEDQPLSSMQGHLVTMRDGVQCPCYLSMPLEAKTPVPLVLMVHGGPNYRDIWGFNPVHQWLSNRGYAVLSVNYRGSTGFGKKHFQLGHGEWAGKMQNDLLDAAQWAVQQKITTQDQIAIMGRSYGGYAVLVGLSMTPEQFCCGVELVGPSNLTTMLKHFPPYWQAMQGAIHEMVGCDPRTPEGQAYLKERSPLFYAHQITKPLLIGHGANDVRVMQAESDQMVEALKQNNIPVTYAVFTDEGHQMLHPANRMAFYQLAEAFLARIFHGKVSADSEQLQTSMQIKIDTLNLMRN